jgi:hypothetical protein
MESMGLPLPSPPKEGYYDAEVMVTSCDPITNIRSANLLRRHMTKSKRADVIVALVKA